MTTSVSNEEFDRTSNTGQILLTLERDPGNSHMNTVIKHIVPNQDMKILNRKIIERNRNSWETDLKDSQNSLLKEIDSSGKPESTIEIKLPKIMQICTNKMSSAPDMQPWTSLSKKSSLLKEKKFFQKCTSLLNKCQRSPYRFFEEQIEKKSDDSNCDNSASSNINNKNNRFVPNILRNAKTGEESSNNNATFGGFCPLLTTRMKGSKARNVGRKRKQILVSEKPECNYSQENRNVRSKNKLHRLLPNIPNRRNSKKKNGAPALVELQASNEGCENVRRAVESCSESLEEVRKEELTTESLDRNVSNESCTEISLPIENLASLDEVVCTDKSVQKILEEFKEPDYKDYIVSEDLCFDEIDEMDKLLSANHDNLHEESSVFNDGKKISEYDMNGNDIENCVNSTTEMTSYTNRWETNDIWYSNNENRAESIDDMQREAKLDINLDEVCSDVRNSGENLLESQAELWKNEFEASYLDTSDYFNEFQSNIKELSSLLDTTSESENNEVNFADASTVSLLEKKDFDYSATSLTAVSDVVPHNVFSYATNEGELKSFESDNDNGTKQISDSGLLTPRNNIDSEDKIDTVASEESLKKFANDFELFNNFDADLGFVEIADYATDDKFSFDGDSSKENQIRDKTDDKLIFDGDLLNGNGIYEKIIDKDDVEISAEHLESTDTNVDNYQFPSNAQLQSYELENKSSLDLNSHYNTSDTSAPELGTLPFTDDEIDDAIGNDSRVVCNNQSKFSYISDDERTFSCESEPETNEHESRLDENRNSDIFASKNLTPSYVNCVDSCSRCRPPFILKRNLDKLDISELEDMLARKKTFDDYSNAYFVPSLAHEVIGGSTMADNNFGMRKNFDDNLYSQVKGSPQVIWRSREFVYRNIEQTSQGHSPQEINISGTESSTISNYEALKIARKNHWLESNSRCDEASLNCQLYSYQISSRQPRASANLSTVTKKSNRAPPSNRKRRRENKELNITFVHCGYCKKKYATLTELTEHIKAVHSYEKGRFTVKRKKYVCDKCSKEYCFPRAIAKHLELHENYSLSCRKCGQHFSEKRFLTFHVYHYHHNRKFRCSYCGQRFARRNDHTRHLKECYGIDDRWLK